MSSPHGTDGDQQQSPTQPDAAAADTVKKPRRARTSERRTAAPDAKTATGDAIRHVEVLELATEGTRDVEGEVLVVRQGGVNVADARQIDIRQGGIGRAHADDIAVTQGGIGFARADRVSVDLGGLGLAVANEVSVTQGVAGTVLARDVRIEQGGARTIIASRATLDRNVGVVMLIAGRVEGNVRTLLDWRGAIAFGAAFGLVAGLVRRRRS